MLLRGDLNPPTPHAEIGFHGERVPPEPQRTAGRGNFPFQSCFAPPHTRNKRAKEKNAKSSLSKVEAWEVANQFLHRFIDFSLINISRLEGLFPRKGCKLQRVSRCNDP